MAASGIAEHDEARRKERVVFLKKAYLAQEKRAQGEIISRNPMGVPSMARSIPPTTTYQEEYEHRQRMGQLCPPDNKSVDQQRRRAHYKQMQEDYSAKIQNRYSSIDYMSQW